MLTLAICIFLTGFSATYLSLFKIIRIAHLKHLFDYPSEERKIHLHKTPNLGGTALFFSIIFCASIFPGTSQIQHLNYLTAAALIIFLLGLTDDLVGVNPMKKFGIQSIVAFLITICTQYRISNLHGFFGIYALPALISITFTIIFLLLIINAFNLIDGINCLASGIALVSFITFSFIFMKLGQHGFMLLSFAMSGSLIAFLHYNKTPSRIFLGDSGSLLIGLLVAVCSLHYLNISNSLSYPGTDKSISPTPAVIFSLFIIPVFDTIRVFTLRLLQRKSPFCADRNHIHHLLLDLNFTHLQASGILILTTLLTLSISIFPIPVRIDVFILCSSLILAVLCRIMVIIINRKKAETEINDYAIPSVKKPSIVKLMNENYKISFSKFRATEDQSQ